MTPALTSEQLHSLQESHGNPVPVVDAASQKLYFIISAEQFQTVQAVMECGDFQPAEMYPLIAKSAAAAGWDSPDMDEYDNYDEHRR